MTVSLSSRESADGELPLAFLMIEHLESGDSTPFVDASGRAVYGARLDRALAAEGIGLKEIVIDAEFAPTGAGDLAPLQFRTRTVGTLDSGTLARVIMAQVRQYTAQFRKGESPALAFVREITIAAPDKKAPPPPSNLLPPGDVKQLAKRYRVAQGPRGGRPRVIRRTDKRGRKYYLDARTHKRVSAEAWQIFKAPRRRRD